MTLLFELYLLFSLIMDFNTLFHIDAVDEPAIGQTGTFEFINAIDAVDFMQRHDDAVRKVVATSVADTFLGDDPPMLCIISYSDMEAQQQNSTIFRF